VAEYASVEDIRVAEEALALWQEWERRGNPLDAAKSLARRVSALSDRFAPILAPTGSG